MKKIIFILFLLLINTVISQEIREVSKEGISEEFGKNEEITVYVAESSSLRIGNPREDSLEKHKFKVLGITTDSVNMTIDQKTNTILIPISQTRKADVDKDGVFDVSITVNSIRSQVASITLKALDDKVEKFESTTPSVPITETKETPEENITDIQETEINTAIETPQLDIPKETGENNIKSILKLFNKNILAVLISVIILILFIVILLIMKQRRKKPETEIIWD